MSKSSHNLYEVCTFPIAIRTPLLPIESICDIYSADDAFATLREALLTTPLIRQAILVASPSLARGAEDWCNAVAGTKTTIPVRVLAYLARMAARTTPYGLCAGIGIVKAGDETNLQLDLASRRTRTRGDMNLMAELIRTVERSPVRGKIRYQRNDAVFRRGGRLYIANVLLANQMRNRADQRPVTLRETEAVRFVRDITSVPQSYDEIAERLCARFNEPAPEAQRLLDALIESGLLISELRVSPVGEPAKQLLDRLSEIDEAVAQRVNHAVTGAKTIDLQPVGERSSQAYAEMSEAFSSLVEEYSSAPLQVDMHAPCSGTLSAGVLADVSRLGEYLMRLGCEQSLKTFRNRFIERYEGRERLVPLLELVDENLGLGNVDGLEVVDDDNSWARDGLLARILCDALRSGSEEVELTAEQLDVIAPPLSPASDLPPMELAFQIAAASLASINAGDYLVVPSGFIGAIGKGRSLGRFLDFLGEDAVEALRDTAEDDQDEHVRAEFVFSPSRDRNYNVMVRPRLLPREIQVGVIDGSNVDRIEVGDLWVGIDSNRFFLWSERLGRRIEPIESHLFNTHTLAPNLCRLLSLIACDGVRAIRGFPWGPLASFTMLPRVKYGKTVLSVRQWTLTASQSGVFSEAPKAVLARLREDWKMPRFVFLSEGDNKLMLDLESTASVDLLRDRLVEEPQRLALFQEMLPAPDQTWLPDLADRRYVAEFVASLVPKQRAERKRTHARAPVMVQPRRRFGPGSSWLFLKFYVGWQAAEEVLLNDIAPLISRLRYAESIERWFYIRYADPENHVRLRIELRDAAATTARNAILAEAESLLAGGRISRYALDTYDPEYERYGGIETIEDVERFFEMDSDCCLECLRRKDRSIDARVHVAAETFFPWVLETGELQNIVLDVFATAARRKLENVDRLALKELRTVALTSSPRSGLSRAVQGVGSSDRLASIFHIHCNRLGVASTGELRAAALLRAMVLSRQSWQRNMASREIEVLV